MRGRSGRVRGGNGRGRRRNGSASGRRGVSESGRRGRSRVGGMGGGRRSESVECEDLILQSASWYCLSAWTPQQYWRRNARENLGSFSTRLA